MYRASDNQKETFTSVPLMPQTISEHITFILYLIAAMSGGVGGAVVAGAHVVHGKKLRTSFVVAYLIFGVVFGLLYMAFGTKFGFDTAQIDTIVGNSIIFGFAGTITLVSFNVVSNLVLKWKGVEIAVTFRKQGENRRDTD